MAAKKEVPKSPSPAKKQTGASASKSANPKVSTDKVTKTPASSSKEHFRFSWGKKHPGAATIRIQLDEASTDQLRRAESNAEKAGSTSKIAKGKAVVGSAEKAVGPSKAKSKSLEEFSETTPGELHEPSTPRKLLFQSKQPRSKGIDDDFEVDPHTGDEDNTSSSDEEENDDMVPFDLTVEPLTPGRTLLSPDDPLVRKTTNPMSRHKKRGVYPPSKHDPNGRKKGRMLVNWHRPRMMEKVLLFLDYECHRAGIELPWDDLVRRLSPGSSGACLTQHLEKLRLKLVSEGHMIPPQKLKPEFSMDDKVRALVRVSPTGDPGLVRIVGWDEDLEHPKHNLEVPGITKGSGKYRRDSDGKSSVHGSHRNDPRLKLKYPTEYDDTLQERKDKVSHEKTKARRERARVKRFNDRQLMKLEPIKKAANGPEDGSDQDRPETPQPTRRSTRKSAAKMKNMCEDAMMQFSSDSSVASQEAFTLPVKLSLSPEKLSTFPAGQTGSSPGEVDEADRIDDEAIENAVVGTVNFQNGNSEKKNLEDSNCDGVVPFPDFESRQPSAAPVTEHTADEIVAEEVDDEMHDVPESMGPRTNSHGHNRVSTSYSVNQPVSRHVSNEWSLTPEGEDDVFGASRYASQPDMYMPNGHADMMSNPSSAYQGLNPYNNLTPQGHFDYNGFNVAGAVAYDHQAAAVRNEMAYNPDENFPAYRGEEGKLLGNSFDDYAAGAVTPRVHQSIFDEGDERVEAAGPQTPGYHDYHDNHGYRGSPYGQ